MRREARTASCEAETRDSREEIRDFSASIPEYPVRSLMRCEAMKMLPCRWSMRCEKRFVSTLRRPSSCEGSSSLRGPSSSGIEEGNSLVGGIVGGLEGFVSSANRRIWERILHCRQVEVRMEGRLGICNVRKVGEYIIESKKSLGANRASGCMAVPLRW